MDYDDDTWLLVLNPVSGRGAGLRDRSAIEAALAGAGLRFRVAVSAHAGHTIALAAAAAAAGCRRVVVAGGDGSLSEAANGLLGQTVVAADCLRLGLIPIGTGNDWARLHRLPHGYAAAAAVLAAGALRRQDVGTIDFADGRPRRFFLNVAGCGFDAGVIERMPDRRLGRLAYLIGLCRELVAYRPLALRWHGPGGTGAAASFVLFACIGRYCGGGMQVAPLARDDDGLLDMALIRDMGRWEVMRSLPQLFDGSIARHRKVSLWRDAWLALDGPAGAALEADGELVGVLPARLGVLPSALPVVVPPT